MVETLKSIYDKYDYIQKQIQELPEGSEHRARQLQMTIQADISLNLAKLVYYKELEVELRQHGR